mgnify:FL=1
MLAFVSPIGKLADGYLFSAHMVQHLLMLLVVPLCLVLALPTGVFGAAGKRWRLDRWKVFDVPSRSWLPMVGWILGVGAMWFWHVPTFCNASVQSEALGAIRDSSFIVAGLAFWWPIYSPIVRDRIKPLDGICYLFSACLGCTLLGIYITFTTIAVCPAFANPAERIGIVGRLYDMGLTPSVDQHLGGLLMWVPPCTLYVCAIVSLLCRWYSAVDPIADVRSTMPETSQRECAP